MKDEDSEASEIIQTLLREGHLPKERQVKVDDECVVELDGGPVIHAQIKNCGDVNLFIHKPEEVVQLLTEEFERAIKDYVLHITFEEGGPPEIWPLHEDISDDARRKLVQAATIYFINNLFDKLNEMLREHIEESAMLTAVVQELLFLDSLRKKPIEVEGEEILGGEAAEIKDPDISKRVNKIIDRSSSARKRRLMRMLSQLSVEERLKKHLRSNYDTLLPGWQEAKRIYRANRLRNWRRMVKDAFPDFPDRLIERLSNDPLDWSAETVERLSAKGGESSASDIALEHAARLCGATPYQYSRRYLYDLKRNSEIKEAPQVH